MFKDFQKVYGIFWTLGVIQKIAPELWENSKFLKNYWKQKEIFIGLMAPQGF